MKLLEKRVSVKAFLVVLAILTIALFVAGCSWDQTSASNQNAQTAGQKWGNSPNITNFYEYKQLKDIYEERDNPHLVLNAYLFSDVTGQLSCMGKVLGFGVPYGTQWSPPSTSGQGAVPEPNALYPSTNTNADWIRLLDSKGHVHITFAEPNLIITDQDLPCTPLHAGK